MPTFPLRLLTLAALAASSGCYHLMPSDGGGQAAAPLPRSVESGDVALPTGYRLEAVARGLTFPSGVTFDAEGRPVVVEAGYAYGPEYTRPRLVRVTDAGALEEVAWGSNGPWNGATFHDGAYYVAQGGHPGRLVKIVPGGATTVLVDDIPSFGDHHTNAPTLGPDGWIYFSQGTATNSGVVGVDNYQFGWLKLHPHFHDVPGQDVTLAGRNFTTANPLTEDPDDQVTTGAFMPFGKASTPGQVVKGRTLASGTVLRVRPEGGPAEQVAWGFRNPFGVAFAPDGKLYVTENGFDVRGSRPVFGSGDYLWEVKRGLWHGWPDYVGGMPIDHARWQAPGEPAPGFLLANHPNVPPKPVASLGVHSSSNGFDFSRSPDFGHVGDAFVAQFGDMAPEVGKVLGPVGFKVVRVNVKTGIVSDFAANEGKTNGPASKLGTGGLERPVAARFSPDGRSLYIVDFGIMTMGPRGPEPRARTGVLWRVTRRAR